MSTTLIDGRGLTLSADFSRVIAGFEAAGRAARLSFARYTVVAFARTFGAPARLTDDTLWCDIGTDVCRILLVLALEDHFSIEISDDEREHFRTLSDLMGLVERRLA